MRKLSEKILFLCFRFFGILIVEEPDKGGVKGALGGKFQKKNNKWGGCLFQNCGSFRLTFSELKLGKHGKVSIYHDHDFLYSIVLY